MTGRRDSAGREWGVMWKYLLMILLFATVASADSITSGLEIGDNTPAHNPKHITGPDAGTTVCPV